MTSTNKRTGFMVALICGVVGLLAFFALPFVSYSGVGVTALTVATAGAQFSGSVGVLWIAAVLAGLVVLMAGLPFRSSATVSGKKTSSGCLLAMGIVGTVLCLVFIFLLNSVSTVGGFLLSFLGLGFWAYILAMIGTIIGAAMSMKQVGQIAPAGPMPFTQYAPNQQPPMQQYAPNQQPPMQQYAPGQPPSSPQYPPYQQPQQYPPNQGQPPSSPQYPPYQQPPQYPNG